MTVFPGPLRFCPVLRSKRFSLAPDLLRVFEKASAKRRFRHQVFCRYESPCTFSGLQSKERGRGRYEPSRLGLLRTLQVGLPFTRAGTARVAERPRATSPISHSPQHTSSHDSRSISVGTMPSTLKKPFIFIFKFFISNQSLFIFSRQNCTEFSAVFRLLLLAILSRFNGKTESKTKT